MSEKRQTCKVFVGGLSWETTDQRLRMYFENYGTVSEAFVSFDRVTGRPRGFGFVVFEDPQVADKVVNIQHTIDRREVEAKKAVPKEENPAGKTGAGASQRTKKIFVGGLAQSVDDQAFRKYFEQYGEVEDAVVMYDHDNKRPRGFGFVTFATEEGVDEVFTKGPLQSLHDKPIEIKRAVPRDQIASARRGAFSGSQTPRLEGAASGPFGAAAMGPAFPDDLAFTSGLLHSHSLNNPSQAHMARLATAASVNGQMPGFSNDISQNLTHSIYNALSGQLSGNLNHQLSGTQLNGQLSGNLGAQLGVHTSVPTHTNGLSALSGNNLLNMARAGSAQLPVGSNHLGQSAALRQLGSTQLPPLPLQNMGSTALAPSKSGLLDPTFGLSTGLQNGLSGNLGHSDLLAQESPFNHQALQNYTHDTAFSNGPPNGYTGHSSPLQNHFSQDTSAFANSATNGYNNNASAFANSGPFANASTAFANTGSAFANGGAAPYNNANTSGLEKAFSGMALEHRPSFQESSVPAATSFEERVQMLSAGSAGLGQLPSPKLPSPYGRPVASGDGTIDHTSNTQ